MIINLVNINIILVSTDLFLEKLLKQLFTSVSSYNQLPDNLHYNNNAIIIDIGKQMDIKDLYKYIEHVSLPILIITDVENNILVQHPLIRFAMIPVHPKIILNQIQNLQEVAKSFRNHMVLGHGLNLYTQQNIIKNINGQTIAKLTSKEQDLLIYLSKASKENKKTRKVILQEVWGKEYVDTKTLESHVTSLRNKLGIYAKYLQVNESGYSWASQ